MPVLGRRGFLKGVAAAFGGVALASLSPVGVPAAKDRKIITPKPKVFDMGKNIKTRLTYVDIDDLVNVTVDSLTRERWTEIANRTKDYDRMSELFKKNGGKITESVEPMPWIQGTAHRLEFSDDYGYSRSIQHIIPDHEAQLRSAKELAEIIDRHRDRMRRQLLEDLEEKLWGGKKPLDFEFHDIVLPPTQEPPPMPKFFGDYMPMIHEPRAIIKATC